MTVESVIGELTSVCMLAVLGSVGAVAIVALVLTLVSWVKGALHD